jgi:cellulose synthase/poly-beta-1,6-N-acetylglucosamine synthase-like glycosyltransferase
VISSILIWLMMLSLSCLMLGWVLYPSVLALLACRRTKTSAASPGSLPSVTVIVATRENAEVVARRVADIRRADYAADRLQVIAALDARIAGSLSEYVTVIGSQAQCVVGDAPGGKSAALNAAVRAASGEILIFADSSQTFSPSAISRLAEAVGTEYAAVSGRLMTSAGDDGGVLSVFWRYEVWIRSHEALIHSVIGVTGAIYAMRRNLWSTLESGLLCDDVAVPMRLILSGHRVGFCDQALAYDARQFSGIEEYRRKVRTQTGILQLCRLEPALLSPLRNPVWIQFVCHKLIRMASPLLLLFACPGFVIYLDRLSVTLPDRSLSKLSTALALLLLCSLLLTRGRLLKKFSSILLLLAAPLAAMYFASRGKWDVWAATATVTQDL